MNSVLCNVSDLQIFGTTRDVMEDFFYECNEHFSRNFKNPKKFWESEKNWNSRFQNFEKIDLIILPNRSNRCNHKKSPNRLDRFIGQRINTVY